MFNVQSIVCPGRYIGASMGSTFFSSLYSDGEAWLVYDVTLLILLRKKKRQTFLKVVGSSIVTIVLLLINKKPEPQPLPTPGFRNGSTGSYIHGQTTFLPRLLTQNATSPSTVDAHYKYQYCGANDCQDAEIVEESIEKYVPNNTTLYIITGSFLLMMVLGMVGHIILIPDMSLADCNELSNSETKIISQDKKSQKKTLKKVGPTTVRRTTRFC